MWIVATFITLVGKALAFIVVPLAIWIGWDTPVFKWLFWPWNSYPNEATGSYYDRWYPNLDHSRHGKFSRWCYNKSPFWREYYWRAFRNGLSNVNRRMYPHAEPSEVVTNRTEHGYYEYNKNHKWQARMQYQWNIMWRKKKWFIFPVGEPEEKAVHVYVGFKLNRQEGSGFTNRLPWRIRNRDY
jgi:hypothetical protein